MQRKTKTWSVNGLAKRFTEINFPEYQREPNIWKLNAKQRLIDSMLRHFDIASLYFYLNENGVYDCIDGRQRIGAIMSFLNENPKDGDDGFAFRVLNEVFDDGENAFVSLENLGYREIRERADSGDELANRFLNDFLNYRIAVVELEDTTNTSEFNLQFARLNLGAIINSGEKLHAMVGDLRDVCFRELKDHPFLKATRIPTRRYSKQQLAAQVLAQVFAFENNREKERRSLARTRHFDLQRLFKKHADLSEQERAWVERTKEIMSLLHAAFGRSWVLRNRAIVVSTVLLAYEQDVESGEDARAIAEFMEEFIGRLTWQIRKGFQMDECYLHLVTFQRHLTQASVERRAVEDRAETLRCEFRRWRSKRIILGDDVYDSDHEVPASQAWRSALPEAGAAEDR